MAADFDNSYFYMYDHHNMNSLINGFSPKVGIFSHIYRVLCKFVL